MVTNINMLFVIAFYFVFNHTCLKEGGLLYVERQKLIWFRLHLSKWGIQEVVKMKLSMYAGEIVLQMRITVTLTPVIALIMAFS